MSSTTNTRLRARRDRNRATRSSSSVGSTLSAGPSARRNCPSSSTGVGGGLSIPRRFKYSWPSGKASRSRRAARRTSRVLPTPPSPLMTSTVRSRCSSSRRVAMWTICWTGPSRPAKGPASAGTWDGTTAGAGTGACSTTASARAMFTTLSTTPPEMDVDVSALSGAACAHARSPGSCGVLRTRSNRACCPGSPARCSSEINRQAASKSPLGWTGGPPSPTSVSQNVTSRA